MGVAKLLVSLVTLSLCVAQKSFTSTSQELLFIFQYSPWAELPKWCFSTEKEKRERERKEGGVGGRKERKENARQKWKEGRRRKRDGVGAGGCRVRIALLCSVLTLESEFYFIKHTRGALYSIWYAWPQLNQSILSSVQPHMKTHTRRQLDSNCFDLEKEKECCLNIKMVNGLHLYIQLSTLQCVSH